MAAVLREKLANSTGERLRDFKRSGIIRVTARNKTSLQMKKFTFSVTVNHRYKCHCAERWKRIDRKDSSWWVTSGTGGLKKRAKCGLATAENQTEPEKICSELTGK